MRMGRVTGFFLPACLLMALLPFASPSAATLEEESVEEGEGWQVRTLLEPVREASLAAELEAKVVRMPFREGERFKKGAVLVGLDCGLFQVQLNSSRAELRKAAATLENKRKLADLQSVGALETQLAEAERDAAQSQVKAAEIHVSRCEIRAPWNGKVVQRQARKHEHVQPGKPLLTIVDDRPPELKLVIPSRWLAWLKPGTSFRVTLDETGGSYPARLIRFGARIDAVSQSAQGIGHFTEPPQGLISGMSGTARFSPPSR